MNLHTQIYASQSELWKVHLGGAWNYIQTQAAQQPWKDSQLGLFSTHLILVLVISMEGCIPRQRHRSPRPSLPSTSPPTPEPLSTSNSTPSPARLKTTLITTYTQSAAALLQSTTTLSALHALSTINHYESHLAAGLASPSSVSDLCAQTCAHLDAARAAYVSSLFRLDDARAQHRLVATAHTFTEAAKAAMRIHLQARVGGCVPRAVAREVEGVFRLFRADPAAGGKKTSVWPLFVAAVEAVEEGSVGMAREWLVVSSCFGVFVCVLWCGSDGRF